MLETLDTKLIEQTLQVLSFESAFHDPHWKEFVETAYRVCVPLDFYLMPASMSGKHHQGYELGVGGLVRHTKAAMIVAKTLFPLYHYQDHEQDLLLAALALHDIAKPSKTHPVEVRPLLEPIENDYYSEIEKVVPLIETHHGQWDCFGKLPRPKSSKQNFVHLCDYISSRKNIAIDINYQEERT